MFLSFFYAQKKNNKKKLCSIIKLYEGGENYMDYAYNENRLDFSKCLSKCFLWMFLGLVTSFGFASIFSYTGLFTKIFSTMGMAFILISSLIEIILVISVSRVIYKLNVQKALTLFFAYSAINGITLSSIFYLYDLTSIIYVFLASATVFGIMAVVGYTTNLDLSKLGTFIFVALIGLFITGFILMLSFNETAYLIYSLLGIGLFMIITTYDIHIIKRMYYSSSSVEQKDALAIYGALQLYLDFINIFLHLLALLAKNRD